MSTAEIVVLSVAAGAALPTALLVMQMWQNKQLLDRLMSRSFAEYRKLTKADEPKVDTPPEPEPKDPAVIGPTV